MGKPFPGPWSHKYHPWTEEMQDCTSQLMVGQKAAQMGYTEVALNKAFYNIDMLGESVLYILPNKNPDAGDFSTSRFDPALELSTHLANLFSDVKNVQHKRAGSANLFIRGSRSRSQLKSLPVSLAIADEVEEMVQDNIALIPERMSGQINKQFFMLSTPSLPDKGINVYYKDSTCEHYFFKCPKCSRYTELTLDCLIITSDDYNSKEILDSHYICKECKNKLDQETKPIWLSKEAGAKWVPMNPDRLSRGFHIPQFYSPTIEPYEIAQQVLKAETNPADEQELYNSKFGMPHEVENARISEDQIDACIGGYKQYQKVERPGLITLGVDVGKWLHYWVDQWTVGQFNSPDINQSSYAKCLREGRVLNFEDLDKIMYEMRIVCCVIDANPEKRKAMEFAKRFYGRIYLCYYSKNLMGKQIRPGPEEGLSVNVDRTSWMDAALLRIINGKASIPRDHCQELRKHLREPARIYEKDSDGNPVSRWVSDKGDHLAHARTYSEIALPLAASLSRNRDISGVF